MNELHWQLSFRFSALQTRTLLDGRVRSEGWTCCHVWFGASDLPRACLQDMSMTSLGVQRREPFAAA